MARVVKTKSGDLDTDTGVLYIGKKPFGIRTYENLLEDLGNKLYRIKEVNMEDISVGNRLKGLLLEVYKLNVPVKFSQPHEQTIVSMVNSGTDQIDEVGGDYVEWLIEQSERLNNPLMVLEREDQEVPSIVQYLGTHNNTIRLKKIRSYATQPFICERELKNNRDIYSIETVSKSDIINKTVVWRFAGTELEHAILETLDLVIKGQLSFQGLN